MNPRDRKLPFSKFRSSTPDITRVGGPRPYVWIGSKEHGVLCVIDKPAQLRSWIRTLEQTLARLEEGRS